MLKAQPDSSNCRIGELARVDHKTVGTVRTKLEATGEIPQLKETVGADGKKRAVMAAADRAEERAVKQQAKAERRACREVELAKKITSLPSKQYGVILADPAWRFEVWSRETGMDRAADNHYPTMTTEEIKALDVASIAAPDDFYANANLPTSSCALATRWPRLPSPPLAAAPRTLRLWTSTSRPSGLPCSCTLEPTSPAPPDPVLGLAHLFSGSLIIERTLLGQISWRN